MVTESLDGSYGMPAQSSPMRTVIETPTFQEQVEKV
jgi:hypothetical protein